MTFRAKCITLFFAFLTTITFTLQAQNKGFSFQGYARDAESAAISSKEVKVRFNIYTTGNEGSPAFTEEHSVTTDAYGVFSAEVGTVSTTQFNNLAFNDNDYWLKVEVQINNGGWVEINKTKMMGVPYANAANEAKHADNGVPPGTILPFGGPMAKIPAGFLACDGAEHNISNYQDLFYAIETSWGGNGTSTFRVPDLRGQFLRGFNGGSGNDPDASGRTAKNGGNSGDKVGSFQTDNLRSHDHDMTADGNHSHSYNDIYHSEAGSGVSVPSNYGSGDSDNDNVGHQMGRTTGSAGQHQHDIQNTGGNETRPTNAAVLYIIKY